MWKRWPSWIGWGAFLLAFLAGMANVVGLLSTERIALTHMTGLTSRLAQGIAEADLAAIAIVAAVLPAIRAQKAVNSYGENGWRAFGEVLGIRRVARCGVGGGLSR